MDAWPTRDGVTGASLTSDCHLLPSVHFSSVYTWRKSRLASSSEVTCPLLYRKDSLPRLSMFLNVQRNFTSGRASPSLSMLTRYDASVANGKKFGPPLGSWKGIQFDTRVTVS